MSLKRSILPLLAIVIGLLLTPSHGLTGPPYMQHVRESAPHTAEDEALYQQRFQALISSFKTGVGLDSYDRLVAVPGANAPPLPLAQLAQRSVSAAAMTAAKDFAEQNHSTALLIYRRGILEQETYFGTTTRETLLNAKSFAKPLTAIAIGRAIALGYITSLDAPVSDYIPQWRNDPVKSKILIRHLLDMRTGFLPQAAAMDPANILNRAYLHPRHDEIIINEYPMTSTPGERYDYSNATSEMVGPVIERATGMSYQDFLSRDVLKPIGADGGLIWMNRDHGVAHSGCCILLPAQSWMRLSILLLNNGQWDGHALLPANFVKAMRTGTAQNPHYGLGVWLAGPYLRERGIANHDRGEYTTLHSEPYAADDLFLFDGNANQVSFLVPSEDLIVMRMGAAPLKEPRWDNAYLPNLVLRGIEKHRGTSRPQSLQ